MFDRISAVAVAAVAGGIIAGGALAGAGLAAADPEPLIPTPAPGVPGAPPAPGQPVAIADEPVGAQPPPPAGAPPVPEVANQQYGQGQTPGQLGYLRDIWHTFHSADPIGELTMAPEDGGVGLGVPAGAGPAPKLPPGYTSLTDPSSSTPALPVTVAPPPGTPGGGPALPPGYVALNDPNPPAWVNEPAPGAPAPAADPAAPPIVAPGAPTP